jgi:hypothetical protein
MVGSNHKGSSRTAIVPRTIYDSGPNGYDITWPSNDLFWEEEADPLSPNSQAHWERTSVDATPFLPVFPTNMMSGVVEAELWGVLETFNDPQAFASVYNGAPWQLGGASTICIYPTGDLGGGQRTVWANFGSTVRYDLTDSELVAAGFDAPSLNSWHIIREQASGTTGAGNLTAKTWLDGNLVKTVSGLTSGWATTPSFWSVTSLGRTWVGRIAYLEVRTGNHSVDGAAEKLAALQTRFGL